MTRLRYNDVRATLDADISAGATTVTFTGPLREWGEDNIATISGGDTLAIRIGWELLHITAYTSGASSATVLRAREGTTATAHDEGDQIRHVLTADDLDDFASGGASVSDTAYDATSWNGVTNIAPSKNAVRDKIESLSAGGAVSVDEEGTPVVAVATAINFVGPSVTVTDGGSNEAVVTIASNPLLTVDTETGTSYTVDADDHGKVKRFTAAGLVTVTLPDGLSVGTLVDLLFVGAAGGAVQDNGTSTVHGEGVVGQYGEASCLVSSSNTWIVHGTT